MPKSLTHPIHVYQQQIVIGDYVFCYNDRPMIGIQRKFEIRYNYPSFRIPKLFGNDVIADGVQHHQTNQTT